MVYKTKNLSIHSGSAGVVFQVNQADATVAFANGWVMDRVYPFPSKPDGSRLEFGHSSGKKYEVQAPVWGQQRPARPQQVVDRQAAVDPREASCPVGRMARGGRREKRRVAYHRLKGTGRRRGIPHIPHDEFERRYSRIEPFAKAEQVLVRLSHKFGHNVDPNDFIRIRETDRQAQ